MLGLFIDDIISDNRMILIGYLVMILNRRGTMEKETILKLIVLGIARVPLWVICLLILQWLIPIISLCCGVIPLSIYLVVVMMFSTFIVSIFIVLRWLDYYGLLK